MITFLLGLPGSGKSYYAVDRIYNNFSDDKEAIRDKKVTFKNCYTNINQFKFDKLNNVYNLDFEKLYEVLERLHKRYKAKKNDKYLLRFLELVKLKDTLIVIDEAHNFFDTQDKVLVWWLSYHRHLHHEIILITQNLSLVNAKYKAFSEFFYVAKPSSLRLFKSHFKYNVFTHSRLAKNSQAGNIKVKQNPKVFELYHSGDSVDTKNIVLKYIIISLIIFLVLVSFFYFFISSKTSKTVVNDSDSVSLSVEKNEIKNSFEDIKNIDSLDDDISKKVFFNLSCSISNCFNENISIPPQLLNIFIKNESLNVLYRDVINDNLYIYYIDCSSDFYKYLISKKEKNEKFNNDISLSDNFKPFGG